MELRCSGRPVGAPSAPTARLPCIPPSLRYAHPRTTPCNIRYNPHARAVYIVAAAGNHHTGSTQGPSPPEPSPQRPPARSGAAPAPQQPPPPPLLGPPKRQSQAPAPEPAVRVPYEIKASTRALLERRRQEREAAAAAAAARQQPDGQQPRQQQVSGGSGGAALESPPQQQGTQDGETFFRWVNHVHQVLVGRCISWSTHATHSLNDSQ